MLVPLYPSSWKSWNAACMILAFASLPAIFELPSQNRRLAHSFLNRRITAERGSVSESSFRTRCCLGRCPSRSSIDNARAHLIGVQIAETAKNSRYVQESGCVRGLRFRRSRELSEYWMCHKNTVGGKVIASGRCEDPK